MEMRLVDVLDRNGSVIHTYPITLDESGGAATEAQFKARALEAAAHGQLVPDAELGSLTSRMHFSRGGPMQPYGDEIRNDTRLGTSRPRTCLPPLGTGRPSGRTS